MKGMATKLLVVLCLAQTIGFWIVGCNETTTGSTAAEQAKSAAENKARTHEIYVPKNDIELHNYNKRQMMADDPTTILWCTTAFPIPSSPLFTVPIVGKLTSGSKRPYATSIVKQYYNDGGEYSPEIPGPDGMFGSSTDFRYGFTPGGMYADWTEMPLFCTQEPTVWQRETTAIVMQSDPLLTEAHHAAREALKAGDAKKAQQVLQAAIDETKKLKNEKGNK